MYRKILVGTDGSTTAARAVDRAVEVAKTTGASLTIMMAAARRSRGEQVVADEVERHAGSGVAIDTKVVEHDAASALVETAEQDGYDLVVVGNRGMTGVSRFFRLGSVPNKVSHSLPTSLLIVRTT